MLLFFGVNMGDYLQHWLQLGSKLRNPPKIFHVNWFRRDGSGRYLWPGFGENIRVLDWIIRRVQGLAEADTTAIGHVPSEHSLNVAGLELPHETLRRLLDAD